MVASLQKKVQDVVKDVSKDDEMVERLLKFKSFADTVLNEAFVDVPTRQTNQDFAYALIDAFATGFKARRNMPAELIARHIDKLMRHGQRGMSDMAFEALLDAALALYRFTDDKDVFRTFYHRALAKRLLLERSASDDFEKAMLKKLKESTWCSTASRLFRADQCLQSMIRSLGWAITCSTTLRCRGTSRMSTILA